jgi:urease accessory protein
VREARHLGPLRIQRAFHPEPDGTAHVVILHPPAGLVGGDALAITLDVEAGSRALFTTTGAGKAYRVCHEREASITTRLSVGEGADAELVPQETVVFDGARARLETVVVLSAGARFLGWEVVCLGRPACAERFEHGALALSFEVERAGRPWFVERGRVRGGDPLLDGAWGLAGHPAFGTLVATDVSVDAIRCALDGVDAPVGVTDLGGLVVVRTLGHDGTRARAVLERARHAVRAAWSRPAIDPAIWRS